MKTEISSQHGTDLKAVKEAFRRGQGIVNMNSKVDNDFFDFCTPAQQNLK